VDVFTTTRGIPEYEYVTKEGITKKEGGVSITYFPERFSWWQYAPTMAYALRKHTHFYDVIHITSVFLSASTLGAKYATQANVPYIISPRGSLMRDRIAHHRLRKQMYLGLVEQRNLANATAIHFTSELEQDHYQSLGLPLPTSIGIPAATPLSTLTHQGSEGRHIVFIGRISWEKGVPILFEAMYRLQRERITPHLTIIGALERDRVYLHKFVYHYRLQGNVTIYGWLNRHEKEQLLASADVFVAPYFASESFGRSAVEAMGAGVPTIITDKFGLEKEVKRMGSAHVISYDMKELKNAIKTILGNPHYAHQLSQFGMMFAQQFKPLYIAEKWETKYRRLIGEDKNDTNTYLSLLFIE
jgi:glycosyltransferase involved in cell wall biosynthesis